MSTWKGISHGRTTRAMERALSPAEFKVVAVVRRLVPDGQRRRIPQAAIATKAKVSEGTVSRTMRKVEGVFFRRHFLGTGRGGGFEIEAIAPAEQLQLPARAPEKGSLTDPSLETQPSAAPTPQTAPEKGSLTDPSLIMTHAHEQQQQPGASPEAAAPAAGQADRLAPETIAALEAAGAHPKLIQRVAANNPGCSPDQVAAAVAAAQAKPNAHTPPGLALECLANRQQVVVPRARPEPAPRAAGAAPPREPPPPADVALGAEEPDGESPLTQARRALPPNAPGADVLWVARRIAAGVGPEAAAEELRAELAARGLLIAPPPRASPAQRPRPEDRVTRGYGRLAGD